MDYQEQLAASFHHVLREADRLYAGGGRLEQAYRQLADRLRELGVAHAVVGGYALILHGVRRFTEDVDRLVTEEGLRRLRGALLGQGYTEIPGNARDIRHAATGVRIEFLVAGQYPGDGREKPVAFPDPAAAAVEIQGIRVVSLERLVELKLASGMTAKGRLQDLADVQRLIQIHCLTAAFADRLSPYVRETFVSLLER
ncbi:MAG: hypothetical protein BWZ02_00076 [Lentisphaerae bacterium ADurb.BinA184]|nr:MAG: hypothetical protein BWZ02_00076 [Lentisphaerae bacterium ADurb.BinA184]